MARIQKYSSHRCNNYRIFISTLAMYVKISELNKVSEQCFPDNNSAFQFKESLPKRSGSPLLAILLPKDVVPLP